jgi:hypothetical protein
LPFIDRLSIHPSCTDANTHERTPANKSLSVVTEQLSVKSSDLASRKQNTRFLNRLLAAKRRFFFFFANQDFIHSSPFAQSCWMELARKAGTWETQIHSGIALDMFFGGK